MHSWISQLNIIADGNVWCAVEYRTFRNFKKSPIGYGETPLEAVKNWYFDQAGYKNVGVNWWDWRTLIPFKERQWRHHPKPKHFNEILPDICMIPSSIGDSDVFVYAIELTRSSLPSIS